MIDKINLRLFDIDDQLVDNFFVDLIDNHYYISVEFKQILTYCPTCGSIRIVSKGHHSKNLVSNPINDLPCSIHTQTKRFECKDCFVSFIDSNPIDYNDTKFTKLAVITILKRLKPYNVTYSQIARDYEVSTQKIVDLFDMFVRIKRKHLPRILLIDEFYFNRNAKFKYPTLLMNFENNLIIDIIESRKHLILSSYFYSIPQKEREEVEYICTDMSTTFRTLIHTYFPNSSHLVDHFHVTKLINDQLNNTRKRIMRKYANNKDSLEYKLLKNKYRILLKCRNDVDTDTFKYDYTLEYHTTENGILESILNIDAELKNAYLAKEEYLAFDQCSKEDIDKYDKRKELNSLIRRFKFINVEEFTEASESLENWKEEILNSFIWIGYRRISNGPIEGKNNYIKKILSNANGMTNFKRTRNRLMYSLNKYETYSLSEHRDSIKNPGKPRGKYKKNKT
ncbi:MAG: ISL3 family transposase [Coprobacillus sp.]